MEYRITDFPRTTEGGMVLSGITLENAVESEVRKQIGYAGEGQDSVAFFRRKLLELLLERYSAETELNFIFGYHA